MELEDENWRICSATLVQGVSGSWKLRTGDFVVALWHAEQSVELEAENWRLCSATLVRGVSAELEDENWRLCSSTLVRGAICGAGS